MSINQRVADYSIETLFIDRWSARAFTGEPIDNATLFSLFEAARWAPSSFNSQPWRFIYIKNDASQWAKFLNLLSEFNRSWASSASALVIVLSKTTFVPTGKHEAITMTSHSFDTGAAWANLALQAHLLGWVTHAIGGFDKQLTREILGIPEGFSLETVLAIGKRNDDISALPDSLRAKETPSLRKPIAEFISDSQFLFPE